MNRKNEQRACRDFLSIIHSRQALVLTILLLTMFVANGPIQADADSGIAAYGQGKFEIAATEFQASSTDARAAYHLGLMHQKGLGGLLMNYTTALNWFQKAGRAGHVGAQLMAASMYERGIGAPQSNKRAADWYKLAAELGDIEGEAALGVRYLHGNGVPRDRYRATLWLSRAAQQGSPAAIRVLESMRELAAGF